MSINDPLTVHFLVREKKNPVLIHNLALLTYLGVNHKSRGRGVHCCVVALAMCAHEFGYGASEGLCVFVLAVESKYQ